MPPTPDKITERFRTGLAARLRLLRQALQVDQPELARHVGVSRQTVSSWERGLSEPTLSQGARILRAAALAGIRVTASWLLGEEEIQFGAEPRRRESGPSDKKS